MAAKLNYRLMLRRPGQGDHLLGRMTSEAMARVAGRACAELYPADCGVVLYRGFEKTCVVWYAGQNGKAREGGR